MRGRSVVSLSWAYPTRAGSMAARSAAAGTGSHQMHGVDQQPEVGPPHVFERGERGRQVADGQAGHRFDECLDASSGGELRQRGELIETAREIGVEADHIYPGNAELCQDVEIRPERAHVGAGQHEEPVTERDAHAAIAHRGEQIVPEPGVVGQGKARVAERHQRHALQRRRNVMAAKVRGDADEFHWRKPEYAEHADAEPVHARSHVTRAGRPAGPIARPPEPFGWSARFVRT